LRGGIAVIEIGAFVASWISSGFARHELQPWQVTTRAVELIWEKLGGLDRSYSHEAEVAVHASAVIEAGAVIKGPAIIGPKSFVASNAYLRGGVFLDQDCIVGPGCELKSTLMFRGSKVAHLSFVGDSIVGSNVNIEAGAIVANYRNEMDDKRILILHKGAIIDTGIEKFGALIGDNTRIGANAVIAPGALIEPGFHLTRLGKVDQHPHSLD
jgi:NDP-sugar pyrophosphorylase family protein